MRENKDREPPPVHRVSLDHRNGSASWCGRLYLPPNRSFLIPADRVGYEGRTTTIDTMVTCYYCRVRVHA